MLPRPWSESAFLMAATLPSIMSEGATMSAPARAKARAWLASRGRVAGLLMVPSDQRYQIMNCNLVH